MSLELDCAECGGTFFVAKKNRQKYCSTVCRQKVANRKARTKYPNYSKDRYAAAKALKPPRTAVCSHCASTFSPTGSTSKWCSQDCRAASKRRGYLCRRCGSAFQSTTKGGKLCDICLNQKCLVETCALLPSQAKVPFTSGYCNSHYLRLRTYGDPLAGGAFQAVRKAIDHEDGTRSCSKCGERKPLAEYYKDRNGSLGRRAYCKSCVGKKMAVY